MSLIVQKFGGTSVASTEIIKNTALHISGAYKQGQQIIVVVSAMAGVTDQLIDQVREIALAPDLREYDVVTAAGEQVACGLMALALKNIGIPAQSWLGWQVPIVTSDDHTDGRISHIDPQYLLDSIKQDIVPVVAGFQGITSQRSITILGRGGSDLTAVTLAAVLKADRCELFKDVDGIFTADPRIVSKARKLNYVTYEEMLELASLGAKVVQSRAIEMAMCHNVHLRIRPTFGNASGTSIISEKHIMEKGIVRSITQSHKEARISLHATHNPSKTSRQILSCLSLAHVNIDMIKHYENPPSISSGMINFTLLRRDAERAINLLEANKSNIGFESLSTNMNIAKISIVGIGLRNHAKFAHILFQTLDERNIPLYGLTTSEIKISILVDEEYAELATRALHCAYGLDQEDTNESGN